MINSYPQELSTGVNNLWTTRRQYAQVIHIFATSLTMPVRSILAGEPLPRIARRRSLVLLAALLLFTNMPNASAINTPRDINTYKLYAHMKLLDAKQYRCVELLWNRESMWNPRSNNPNSSAYGIPQMLKMKEKDPYLQIDLGLKYIKHKHRTPCQAWEFHKRKGWY
jgi:hypothetical protein